MCCAPADIFSVCNSLRSRPWHAIDDAAIEQLITAYPRALSGSPIRTGGTASSMLASPRRHSTFAW
jgi:hypothetical protein